MAHSYSDILTWQRCPKKYEYSVVRKLQRKKKARSLTLGTLFHRLLMAAALDEYQQELELLMTEVGKYVLENDENAFALLDLAEDMVMRYLDHYQDDEWELLHVEETFEATVDGVALSFTPDLVIRDATGVWIVDHKTSSSLPQTSELPVGNFQSYLYSALMREVYPDFRGFIFNYVRSKMPTQPRLTKTGELRVADLKRIDTTFEMLRDFLMDEAPQLLNDPDHQQRLAELKDNDRWFWRDHVFTPAEVADTIIEETLQTVQLIEIVSANNGPYPRHFLPYASVQECDRCPFRELCVAELRGYNTDMVLDLYEERDTSHRNYDHETEELL